MDSDQTRAERADPSQSGHLAAPFHGVITLVVQPGSRVRAGDPVGRIEAMKLEAPLIAPVSGTVQRVTPCESRAVDGGDLVLVLG